MSNREWNNDPDEGAFILNPSGKKSYGLGPKDSKPIDEYIPQRRAGASGSAAMNRNPDSLLNSKPPPIPPTRLPVRAGCTFTSSHQVKNDIRNNATYPDDTSTSQRLPRNQPGNSNGLQLIVKSNSILTEPKLKQSSSSVSQSQTANRPKSQSQSQSHSQSPIGTTNKFNESSNRNQKEQNQKIPKHRYGNPDRPPVLDRPVVPNKPVVPLTTTEIPPARFYGIQAGKENSSRNTGRGELTQPNTNQHSSSRNAAQSGVAKRATKSKNDVKEVMDLCGDTDDDDDIVDVSDGDGPQTAPIGPETRRLLEREAKQAKSSFDSLDDFRCAVPTTGEADMNDHRLIALEFGINNDFSLVPLKRVFWGESVCTSVGTLKCMAGVSAQFSESSAGSPEDSKSTNFLTRLGQHGVTDQTAVRSAKAEVAGKFTILSVDPKLTVDDLRKLQCPVRGEGDNASLIKTEIPFKDIDYIMKFPVPNNSVDSLMVLALSPNSKLTKKGIWFQNKSDNNFMKRHFVTLHTANVQMEAIVDKCKKFPKLNIRLNTSDRLTTESALVEKVGPEYVQLMKNVGLVGTRTEKVITAADYEPPRRMTRHSAKLSSPVNLTGDDSGKRVDDPTANDVYAVYPLQDDAVGAVTVRKGHLERLEEGVYLNDELIDFQIRHLIEETFPEAKSRVHIFNSHFFIQLRDNGYSEVSKWTKNVDLFDKEFLFVPINQSDHWSLVVIARPGLVEGRGSHVSASPKPGRGRKRASNGGDDSGTASKRSSPVETTETTAAMSSSSSSSSVALTGPKPPSRNSSDNAMDVVDESNSQATARQQSADPTTAAALATQENDGLNNTPSGSDTSDSEVTSKVGELMNGGDLPCFICLDSLKMHPMKAVCRLLRGYLKNEWKARHPGDELSVFDPTPINMPCIDVNAPRQYDGFSCGVYTIKFAELILREPPRTTATVLDERFGSYVQPGSISKEDAKRMRRDMLNTLKDLHILYVERVARQKKERAERREKRLQEKAAAAVAAVQASSSSGVADAKQDAGDQVSLSDDQVSIDTASTSMSVIKPISPVAAQTSKQATASSASGNIQANEKTRVQTSSSQNSDWVSLFEDPKVASTTTVNTTAKEGEEEEDDVMPRGRASSRVSGAFKSSSTSTKPLTASNIGRKAKKPVESESDESDSIYEYATPSGGGGARSDVIDSSRRDHSC